MPQILCLREEILSGASRYPIFVGFAPASTILELAEAPAFTDTTNHCAISDNILTPPVKDWQRPLDTARVGVIASVYNNTGELMPNPVLLCANVLSGPSTIAIVQQSSGGIPTNIWAVNIPQPQPGQSKPLWILDGQHRINGLARSLQQSNALPVVLLLNQNVAAYGGPLVAKLFAQVTTAATALDKLHNEWLTFAFKLGAYHPSSPASSANSRAMECVAELCRKPTLPTTGAANPFYDCIKFNAHDTRPCGPIPGGFKYDCLELKELIRAAYYSVSAPGGGHLSPIVVAEQVALAFGALTQKVAAPQQDTVFFGDHRTEQRIMQDAFLYGVLGSLITSGPKADWGPLLDTLRFPITSWDFRWVLGLNGSTGTISRQLALSVFTQAFRNGALPTGSGTLADYLKGNDAEIEITFSPLTGTGRPSQHGRTPLIIKAGNTLSSTIAPARHFKVTKKSGNIGRLEIIDKNSPIAKTVYYRENGERLDAPSTKLACSNPLSLLIRMHHYGGIMKEASLDLRW